MALVIRASRLASSKTKLGPTVLLISTMIAAVLVLMAAHTVEVIVWAFAYFVTNAAPVGTDRVYFAFVNYTTLGYGDVIPVKNKQLLGPITAMNGILLFGWSTAVIFEVLRQALIRDGD
jgi:Ion channel